ncbi:MAG: PQQ-binding-like beta-propeller repeat protein [Armatimonadetes bacterium]|nr:PQQ-binding-like beta-propeller repeat protein [Armatimonadota bacterium]
MKKLIFISFILLQVITGYCFTLEWSFQTGDRILSHPVLDEGVVYFGSNDNNLYALDAENGDLIWNFQVDFNVQSSPVIHDSLIFFESGNSHFALNKYTGEEIWSYIIDEPYGTEKIDYWDYHHAAPVIVDSIVVFACGDGNLYAYNLHNGNPFFMYTTLESAAIRSTPVQDNYHLYFGDWDGRIYSYNLVLQDTLWCVETYQTQPYPTFGQVNTKMVVHDSLLIFGARNPTLQVFNKFNGNLVWDYTVAGGGWISGDALVVNDTLYIGGSDCNKMFAFDVYSGELLWDYTFLFNNFSEPVIYEDMIIFTTGDAYAFQGTNYGDGYLYALQRNNGTLVNYERIGGNLFTTPIIHDGKIYIGSSDTNFYCVDLDSFINGTGTEEELLDPRSNNLYNYPNPFNPATTISFYSVNSEENTSITIYNLKGQKVKELIREIYLCGEHSIVWDGTNASGEEVNSGLYFVKLQSGQLESINKILLLK